MFKMSLSPPSAVGQYNLIATLAVILDSTIVVARSESIGAHRRISTFGSG
jgi:hypothetical protein